ncbi:hypothetical protein ACA910_021501 [Epithemia clementina (nom. ined.)]
MHHTKHSRLTLHSLTRLRTLNNNNTRQRPNEFLAASSVHKKKKYEGQSQLSFHHHPKKSMALNDMDVGSRNALLSLQKILWRDEGLCASEEEAEAIVEDLVATRATSVAAAAADAHSADATTLTASVFAQAMNEYFDISTDESNNLFGQWSTAVNCADATATEDDYQDAVEEPEVAANSINKDSLKEDNDEDDDGEEEEEDEYVGEGECGLCERYIRISRHHLIPRSTWSRIEPKLMNAAQTLLDQHDIERARRVVGGEGLWHLLDEIEIQWASAAAAAASCPANDNNNDQAAAATTTTKSSLYSSNKNRRAQLIRQLLQRTCNICRPCHTAVHQTYDNLTLAWEYNTMDKLLQDPRILKFSKWASQQRTGPYSRRHRV